MRFLLLNVVFLINAFAAYAQSDLNIDAYRLLSSVYASKNTEDLRQVYSDNAVLLNLYQKSEPEAVVGFENIQIYYTNFLKDVSSNGQNLELVFKITNRKLANEKVYDSGYYQLVISELNGNSTKYSGKFNTILSNEGGHWIISHDATTDNVDGDAFDQAEGKFSF